MSKIKMIDDFRDFNLDKPLKKDFKTPEQLSKHTIDEDLNSRPIERACQLLRAGDDFQRISVMKNLPSLITEDLSACIQTVIPQMKQTLSQGSTEYNMAACEVIRTVASDKIMPADNFTKVFLQHILDAVNSRDTVAAEEWLNTLLDIIPILPICDLQKEVLPIAVNKAHISKPVAFRINSCKILGRLALTFSPNLVKKDIIPLVISLCQDVSERVRATMAAQLPNISATLGQETGACMKTLIADLTLDNELIVQEAVLEAIANMLPRFHTDDLKSVIMPYTKKVFPKTIEKETNLLFVLSKYYGQYAIGLKNVMVSSEKDDFLKNYIKLSKKNANTRHRSTNFFNSFDEDEEELALLLTECRLNCAYNYPAMVVFASDRQKADDLIAVLQSLASDSFSEVRKKIAAGFFEVMKLMPRWHSTLKIEFIKLLKDDMDIVLGGLVPNIGNILQGFSSSDFIIANKSDSGLDIIQALCACEKRLAETSKWRLFEELLLELRVVPKIFHHELVSTYFVPLLMERAMNGRILPCRVAALHTLLVIIADPSQVKNKLKIRHQILELCQNSSFHCRLLFLKGMRILLSLSPVTVKELFFYNITSMAYDKVANIRLVLSKMLPDLKSLALDSEDSKLLANLDAAVLALSADTDRDVCAEMEIAHKQMAEIHKSKGIRKVNTDHDRHILQVSPNEAYNPTPAESKSGQQNHRSRNQKGFGGPSSTLGRQGSNNRQGTLESTPSSLQGKSGSNLQQQTGRHLLDPRNKRSLDKFSSHDFLIDAGIPLKTTTELKRIPTPRPTHRNLINLVPPDDFLVDAGISLKNTNDIKQIPTSRPVHRTLVTLVPSRECEARNKPESRRNFDTTLSPISSLGLVNKNLNVPNYPSSLPVKKTHLKPLSNDEIEKELMQSEKPSPFTRRTSNRLKYTVAPVKNLKKENKRLSLDVAEIVNNHIGPQTRSSNINKRYSLNVDTKKEYGNKKSLTCINNNTLLSPKLSSTRPGIVRPQSCVLQSEKVNHSKRSMSVENLPPKVTRLASRLPVRSTDPKPSKPK